MIFRKDKESPLRVSTMRSNITMLREQDTTRSSFQEGPSRIAVKIQRTAPKKPTHLSRRSVSLPADLQNTNVTTKKLFWFIPNDNRRRRRSSRRSSHLATGETSTSNPERQFDIRRANQSPPLCLELPEKAGLEWLATTSTKSFSDHSTSDQSEASCEDDVLDGPLLGLEFVESNKDDHR